MKYALTPFLVAAFLALATYARAAEGGAAICRSDLDCSDGVYCNGAERCAPTAPAADARGCIPSPQAQCRKNEECFEQERRCYPACPEGRDRDEDGRWSVVCSGDDCDDEDAGRYPGHPEVWDRDNLDEDCDPQTDGFYETEDFARLGQICWGARVLVRYRPLSATFESDDVTRFRSGGRNAAMEKLAPCPAGTACLAQPHGHGVCAPPPAGYVPPPLLVPPFEPRQGRAARTKGAIERAPDAPSKVPIPPPKESD